MMRFVNVRDLRINASRILDIVRSEDVVVTRRGKPAAAVIYLDEDLIEDFILAHHPTLMGETEEAYQEYKKKGGLSQQAMRQKILKSHG